MRNKLFIILVLLAILESCSVKKFVPEGKLLYSGADIKIETDTTIQDKDEVKTELQTVLRPKPNSRILGMPMGLYFYYKAQKEHPGFINKFLNKKFGQAPVYLSDVDVENTEELLLNRLENRGFFYSRVESNVSKDEKAKTASASYELHVPEPYRLETYQLDTDTMMVYSDIKKNLNKTLIKEDMRFDLPVLKNERERIDRDLKENGYYNFNPGFLIFEADTNQYANKKFDLYLRLKKDVPNKSIIPYQISNVNVYANYNVDEDSLTKNYKRYKNKNYFQDELIFKPKYLDPYILIETGDYYDPAVSSNTSRRLGSIGSYKFVNIQYEEIDTLATDSLGLIQANIFLSPLKKRAIRAELQGVTKSNNFSGPHLAVTFSNRNLFKGGESLHITANVGYEYQVGSGNQKGRSSLQLGLTNDLIIPRLIFPIQIDNDFFRYDIPRTKISLGGEYLRRTQLFTLTSLNTSFGYYWNANRYVSHELNPIDVHYVKLANVTPEFDSILSQNTFLENSFKKELIAGLTYSFIYNGMVDLKQQNVFFFNGNLDIAGNTFSLFGKPGSSGKDEVLGLEYAQYAKVDGDFRYHYRMSNEHVIATRLFAGIGIPYGNSDGMPFSKQYFAGGPYSVRAFQIRSLGPGTYTPDGETDQGYGEQNGNIRLEANAEYRFPIVTYLNGAFFMDAGNVWTTQSDDDTGLTGGKFTSNFINELGIGTGAGLRIDIQNFVIRFDVGFPLHDPRKEMGNRWEFGFNKPVFNFAIGYPF